MAEFDDLINKFGSKSLNAPAATNSATGTPFDDLINKFGGDTIAPTASTAPQAKLVHPPISGVTPEQSDTINAQSETVSPQQPVTVSTRLGNVAMAGATQLWKSTSENFKAGLENFTSGVSDISKNDPYRGVGKVGLGVVQGALAPISGALDTVGKGATELTGNPEFGKKSELLAGTALPVSKAGSAISSIMPTSRALKDIVSRIGSDNIPEVVARLKSNTRLTLMDVAPSIRTDIQGLAASPSKAQEHLSNVVKQRTREERSVVEQAHNDLMGPVPNVKDLLDGIAADTKKVGKEIINPAVKNAGPVDIAPVLQHIKERSNTGINAVVSAGEPLPDDFIIKGLKDVRQFLTNDKQQLTDASRLHNIQSALRVKAEGLLSSANGQDRLMGYELMKVRGKLVDAIDTASGPANAVTGMGPYKTGLSKYKAEKEFPEAIEKGMQIFKNNPNQLENRPEFWEALVKGSNDKQLEGLKIGARLAADNQIRGMRFASRKGENIPEVEFNAERLEHLFGKKETTKYAQTLADEKDIAQTTSDLFKGSQTATRLLGAEARKVREPIKLSDAAAKSLPFAILEGIGSYSGVPGVGTATALALGGGRKVANMTGRALDKSTNTEYAKLASATGKERDEIIKVLENFSPKLKQPAITTMGKFALPVFAP